MRVLIVEDEVLIREGLMGMVDWAAEGFSEVIGCENAVDALEILTDKGAELVIADIYMEAISGLDMIEMARQMDVYTNFVILTGHGLFEHAQRAVELGVRRFLTKPILPEELRDLLKAMRAEIAEQQRVEQALQQSEARLREYYPLVLRDFWSNLTHENSLPEETIQNNAEKCDIHLPEGSLQCVALTLDAPDPSLQTRLSVRKVLEELTSAKLVQWLNQGASDLIILMEGLSETEVSSLIEVIRANFHLALRVGLGRVVRNLTALQTSAREAVEAMKSIIATDSAWRFYSDLTQVKRAPYPVHEEETALDAIRYHDSVNGSALDAFLEAVYEAKDASQRDLMLSRFQVSLYRVADEYGLSELPAFSMPPAQESLPEAKARLFGLMNEIARRKAGTRQNAITELIDNAKRIIGENYADPELNVSAIARQLSISPQYLSRLFRGVCDMTCMDYITSVRLNAAKKLLSGTQIKTYEIALMVGYNHPNYFSALFKKHERVTPKQYRMEHGHE